MTRSRTSPNRYDIDRTHTRASLGRAMSWVTTAIVFVAGICSGILASVLGVGGAVITTPLIRFLGATPIEAVGSTVPAILPGAISGSLRYHREGYIEWPMVWRCGGCGMIFAVAGGWVADIVNPRWLMIVTALLVLWSGISLVRSGEPAPSRTSDTSSAQPVRPSQTGSLSRALALGATAGFLAGLLGVGGGVVLTPGLSLVVGLPMKRAIATSLASVSLMSTTALATHIALGHINWAFALPLAAGIVPGAQIGAHLTVAAQEQTMRRVAGVLLIIVAIIYLATEMRSL